MINDFLIKHDELLKRWKNDPLHRGKVFIEDGIIDYNKWKKAKKKIMFFLKEAYGGDKNWSLTKTIKDKWKGPKYKMWWTISYWQYVLLKTNKNNIPLFPSSDIDFKECCIIGIKK